MPVSRIAYGFRDGSLEASEDLTLGKIVTDTDGKVALAGQTDTALGIVVRDAKAGELVTYLQFPARCVVDADTIEGTVSAGDELEMSGTEKGKVMKASATPTGNVIGRVLRLIGSEADVIFYGKSQTM